MRRDLTRVLRLCFVLTIALAAVAIFASDRVGLAVRVAALVLCGELVVVALLALRRAYPPETPIARASTAATPLRQPPPSLTRIELETALGVAGSFDLHHRLAPRLRSIAAGRLSTRGVSLDGEPAVARALLGDTTWELVRPDRPAPADRLGRGVAPDELSEVVGVLESV
jgi:hypothetical protein